MKLFWHSLYFFLALMFLIVCWWVYQPAQWFMEKSNYQQQKLTQPKDLKVSLAYELDNNQWISFPINTSTEVLKVISNAVLPIDYKISAEERWVYAMEYELLDDQNQRILAGDIYHKTGQTIFYDETLKQPYVAATFYHAEQNPVDARLHLINFSGFSRPVKLRLRAKYKQAPIENVIVRLYQQEQIAGHKLTYLWQRMGEEKRKKLSRSSVYDQDLLSDIEKDLLMQTQWLPMGPLGVNETDYISKKIYIAREVEEDVVISLPVVPPEGLLVYPDKYGVVKIPVFPGRVKLKWQAVQASSNSDKISIEWWGHPATRYKQWHPDLATGEIILPLESGVIQLSATTPVVFRIWMKAKDKPVEITPVTRYLRVYQPTQAPVVYNINHNTKHNTTFKIDLRRYLPEGEGGDVGGGEDDPEYRLFNKQGQVIQSGFLKTNDQASPYSTVISDQYQSVSKPASYYFNLTTEITRIELYAKSATWVSAYTRPSRFPLTVNYPYKQENATQQTHLLPAWYFVRPNRWKNYVAEGRSVLLSVQSSPPDIDPMLMAGQFRWDQFLPQGNWRGRELLSFYDDGLPGREQSMGSRYVELPLNAQTRVRLQGYSGEAFVLPQLMYLQKNTTELNIKLWLNDQLFYEDMVYAKDGEISLPPVAPGEYRIKLETSRPARILLDHVAEQNKGYIKRMAIQLTQKQMEFNYLKEYEDELIAVRVYAYQQKNLPQKIKLEIVDIEKRGAGPFSSWTIANREYNLEPGDGPDAKLLQTRQSDLAPSRLFFVPLGGDLPKGKQYRIKIKLETGPVGYLILTRSLPGKFDSREIRQVKTLSE